MSSSEDALNGCLASAEAFPLAEIAAVIPPFAEVLPDNEPTPPPLAGNSSRQLRAQIEWHTPACGTLRVLSGDYGTPYVWHTTVVREGKRAARFHGALDFRMAYRGIIRDELARNGITVLRFSRFDRATLRGREVELRQPPA